MRTIILFMTLIVSANVFATEIRTRCEFSDFQRINKALDSGRLLDGTSKDLAMQISGWLGEEMGGPECTRIDSTELVVSIPEYRSYTYELVDLNQTRGVRLDIGEPVVVENGFTVSITTLGK